MIDYTVSISRVNQFSLHKIIHMINVVILTALVFTIITSEVELVIIIVYVEHMVIWHSTPQPPTPCCF